MTRWTDKAERGSAWLIRLIAWLARTAGRTLCRGLLYPIVLYFVLTDSTARRASAEFLQTVHGRPARWREVFAHIYNFAVTLLDRVYMAAGDFDRFEVTIEGLDRLEQALQSGHGCLLLGSHLGSFDLLLLAQRAMDRPRKICVMMRVDPRARVRRIAGVDDGALDVIALGHPESYIRANQALEAGNIVGVLADRTEGAAELAVRFLGRPAALPIAPHVLAARSQAPVLMCFGLYDGDNRYRIEFVDFGPPAPPTSRGDQLQCTVDHYATVLERYARRYPLNWFNFYPYWADEGSRA
jgi:predicted LPLAT superfamily acyltransferase